MVKISIIVPVVITIDDIRQLLTGFQNVRRRAGGPGCAQPVGLCVLVPRLGVFEPRLVPLVARKLAGALKDNAERTCRCLRVIALLEITQTGNLFALVGVIYLSPVGCPPGGVPVQLVQEEAGLCRGAGIVAEPFQGVQPSAHPLAQAKGSSGGTMGIHAALLLNVAQDATGGFHGITGLNAATEHRFRHIRVGRYVKAAGGPVHRNDEILEQLDQCGPGLFPLVQQLMNRGDFFLCEPQIRCHFLHTAGGNGNGQCFELHPCGDWGSGDFHLDFVAELIQNGLRCSAFIVTGIVFGVLIVADGSMKVDVDVFPENLFQDVIMLLIHHCRRLPLFADLHGVQRQDIFPRLI